MYRQALATTFAVGFMVKLGITHPPAGAVAFIFSSGGYHWTNIAFLLLADIIAIAMGTVINNISDKRQYPTSWGLRPVLDWIDMHLNEERGEKVSEKKQS